MHTVITVWVQPASKPGRLTTATIPASIGRDPQSSVVLEDSAVSGTHAHVIEKNGKLVVADADSANGVLLGGRAIRESPWRVGQVLQLGATTLTLLHASSAVTRIVTTRVLGHTARRQALRLPAVLSPATGAPPMLDEPLADSALLVDAGTTGLRAASIHDATLPIIWRDVGSHGQLRMGDVQLELHTHHNASHAPTELLFNADGQPVATQEAPSTDVRFPPASFEDADRLSMAALHDLRVPVIESEFLALGGGMGSFCWVDALRVRGVSTSRIAVVGFETVPYARYKRLCQHSQIPLHERLRSNSESCPDNVWGFPGYALRETWRQFLRGRWVSSASTAWQVVAEPDLSSTYTPRAGDVFDAVDREATRIGWGEMMQRGRIRSLRMTDDGRYAVAVSSRSDAALPNAVYVGQQVHIALGYPGLQFLPDLRKYREDTLDFRHVVNAYEDHDHVYDALRENGGTVVLRGRGIVSSRVLQRIHEARQSGAEIHVVHLMRSPNVEGNRAGNAKRHVENHWEFQPFNWPEACWGGDLERRLRHAPPADRANLLRSWGGTTTADRTDWRDIVRTGLARGWYRIVFGEVGDIQQASPGLHIDLQGADTTPTTVRGDYIIDATGLIATPHSNPFWADLIQRYELDLNPAGRIRVTPEFRIPKLQQGKSAVYAAGVATLGGPYAPVDSFLGLQYAAQAALERTPGVPRFGPGRSISGWLRWIQGVAP